ncbi:SDR family NAD(P)-dependent oxidoreductase [Xanthobacter autotrophicus]|uniref:SDR family NAD(P)-dependent oxidoreductase n=1 Tax=Xanthobacter autotrophicus TaxID=280 RepID=UPI00372BF8DF
MPRNFQGKVIWITGASGALGRASAETLAAEGATVIASSRRREALPEGERIIPLPLDVTATGAAEEAAREIVSRFGRLDGLVTSTALPIFGDFLSLDDAAWQAVIDAKLLGTVRLVRAALPHFISAGRGSIVVLSGRGGLEPSPQHLPGSSVNAALILLVRGLGAVYGPKGVRINAVSPGPIKSPRLDALNAAGTGQPPQTPIPGPGLPTDVADAVAFLLSDEARFITGANLLVDGGGRALS